MLIAYLGQDFQQMVVFICYQVLRSQLHRIPLIMIRVETLFPIDNSEGADGTPWVKYLK